MIHVTVFWVVTPYKDVTGYKCFRRPCCLHLQGGSMVLWNVCALPHHYMVSQSRI